MKPAYKVAPHTGADGAVETAADGSAGIAGRRSAPPLGWLDWLLMAAALVLMAIFCYTHSRGKTLWTDELAGYVLLRQPSFLKMIHDWRAGVDSGSILYVIGGRWWLELFSPAELSLRAFSATGVAASFVILWVTARRFFPVVVVGLCMPLAYFFNPIVDWHYYNGRMYGGFLAGMALVLYAFVRAAPGQPLTRRVLWLTFFAHLLLMCSHILGPLYSGTFIAGLMLQDGLARQFRPRLYLSAAASWFVLLFSFANIRATSALAKYGYFTQTPHLKDFVRSLGTFDGTVCEGLALLFVIAFVLHMRTRSSPFLRPALRPIHLILLCFFCLLLFTFALSRVAQSVFYERYLLPVCLGDALLLCELVDRIRRDLPPKPILGYSLIAVGVAIFAATFAYQEKRSFGYPGEDHTAGLLERIPPGVPLVTTNAGMFLQMVYYRNNSDLIVYPLDWKIALDPDAGPGGSTDVEFVQRWKTAGYYDGQILTTQQVLARLPQFLLLTVHERSLWFRRYILNNPAYSVVNRGTYYGDDLWLVTRR